MNLNIRWRVLVVFASILVAVWALWPTYRLYKLTPEEREHMDPVALQELKEKSLRLGLDLQGGMHMVLELDDSKLDYSKTKNARADRDFAITWSKMHGKGRVFYSSLGHTRESWQDPDVQKMYLEAIRWVLGGSEGSTASHPKK